MLDPILPPDRCVVKVLEDVAADAEVLEAVTRLKFLGYRIALDDFVLTDKVRPLVAEKIESEAEFRWCRKRGCELFQGYNLRKPEVVAGRRIPSNQLSVLPCLPSAPIWKLRLPMGHAPCPGRP
jgi:EAL and modified HD-GYP domain-containing signal transduction protein